MWEIIAILFYAFLALPGAAVLIGKKCFVSRNVLGVDRWEEGENPAILMILSAVGFFVWMMATQALMKGYGDAATQPTTRPMDLHDALAGTLGQLTGLLALIGGNLAMRKKGLATLGLGRPLKGVLPGLAAASVALPVVFVTNIFAEFLWKWIHYQHSDMHEMLEVLLKASKFEKLLPIASAVIVAPLFEETLFRGHIQTFFKRSFHTAGHEVQAAWMSILLASGMFMVVHPAWTYPQIFALAVCMGYVYERTGNLWATIFLHMIFNGVQVGFTMGRGG